MQVAMTAGAQKRLNVLWRSRTWLLPVLLLSIHAGLLLVTSRLQFPTRNEVAHVPAGLSHWNTGTFELYNVNPPLGNMIATVPTLILNAKMDGIPPPVGPGERAEWAAARQFANNNFSRYFELIWSARLAEILWSVVGGIVVYRWAGALYGWRGGLLALALWCFGRSVMRHSPVPSLYGE